MSHTESDFQKAVASPDFIIGLAARQDHVNSTPTVDPSAEFQVDKPVLALSPSSAALILRATQRELARSGDSGSPRHAAEMPVPLPSRRSVPRLPLPSKVDEHRNKRIERIDPDKVLKPLVLFAINEIEEEILDPTLGDPEQTILNYAIDPGITDEDVRFMRDYLRVMRGKIKPPQHRS